MIGNVAETVEIPAWRAQPPVEPRRYLADDGRLNDLFYVAARGESWRSPLSLYERRELTYDYVYPRFDDVGIRLLRVG